MWELEGTTLGRYQLQHRLARGGMSLIYLAHDTRMRRTVAVKIVHHNDKEDTHRFQREVYALSKLKHPHILPIFEYGEYDLYSYCAMPYIAQGTLRERLAQGPLSLEETALIFTQTASALQYAHEHGIIHRDIKPANILLRHDRHIYLADFGLAKELEASSTITADGELIGTPEYMAPELIEQPASPASDIYALGILLYLMLTGQVPFKTNNPIATCRKHLLEQPVPPSLLNPAIPPSIEQVVLHALEKDPEHRFPTVHAMSQAFKQALPAAPRLQTMPLAFRYRPSKASTRTTILPGQQTLSLRKASEVSVHPALVALLATIVFALSLSLGFFTYIDGLHPQPSPALSANILLVKASTSPHEMPPHLQPPLGPFLANNNPGTPYITTQSTNSNKHYIYAAYNSSGSDHKAGDHDNKSDKHENDRRHKQKHENERKHDHEHKHGREN